MTDGRAEDILRVIERARKKGADEDFTHFLNEMDDSENKKVDVALVSGMGDILEHDYLSQACTFSGWRHRTDEVATGKYPLEKLPDHVRDLAKTLYYK